MPIFNTRVEFTDSYAQHPTETGLSAWKVLDEHQRYGDACIDCGSIMATLHTVGWVAYEDDEQREVGVCPGCRIERLKDHIDYYRPSSS